MRRVAVESFHLLALRFVFKSQTGLLRRLCGGLLTQASLERYLRLHDRVIMLQCADHGYHVLLQTLLVLCDAHQLSLSLPYQCVLMLKLEGKEGKKKKL